MYQATCRMMAEANPMKTQRLLQKSVMQQRSRNEQKFPSKLRYQYYFLMCVTLFHCAIISNRDLKIYDAAAREVLTPII